MRVFFFLICPPYVLLFLSSLAIKRCAFFVHRRPSLSTAVHSRGYSNRLRRTLISSFVSWNLGEEIPLARHATTQTPQREKKNKHYVQIKIIHIKKMKQALHVDVCIKNVWWRQGRLNVKGPWLRVILVFRLLMRGVCDLDAPSLAAVKIETCITGKKWRSLQMS